MTKLCSCIDTLEGVLSMSLSVQPFTDPVQALTPFLGPCILCHIYVISVVKMSIQSFTELVGTGSKSNDLHEANRTRQRTSSGVTQS